MKNIIIIIALLASPSLILAENVDENKSVSISQTEIENLDTNKSVDENESLSRTGIDGSVFYAKRCSKCHGKEGKNTPLKGMIPIAGIEAGTLARKVRAYRDQDQRHGAYAIYEVNMLMKEATYSLSNGQISAIAIYISRLK